MRSPYLCRGTIQCWVVRYLIFSNNLWFWFKKKLENKVPLVLVFVEQFGTKEPLVLVV
jgi:hypothetical protein